MSLFAKIAIVAALMAVAFIAGYAMGADDRDEWRGK